MAQAANTITTPATSFSARLAALEVQLSKAGMWLEHRGTGWQIMFGAQPLAYHLTLDQAQLFTNRALLR
jgi:hypothetical protein